MRIPHVQVEWDHWRVTSLLPDHVLRVSPEPEHPRGRKARHMADYWRRARAEGAQGVLWQDPDIVLDPDIMAAMRRQVELAPEAIHVSVHKLWPASTMRDDWVWAHGLMKGETPVMSQRLESYAAWFALGFTYTPARLLDLALPHMPAWVFGQVDSGLGAVARQHAIPAHAAGRVRPVHLHFYPRPDDASWRPGYVDPR